MAGSSPAGPRAHRLDAVETYRAAFVGDSSQFDVQQGKPVTLSRIARVASSSPDECRFLHALTYHHAPFSIVEMGTAIGISAAAIATAMPEGARMWTVDLRDASAQFARDLFDKLSVPVNIVTGRFDEVLVDVLREAAPVDLLFVDGHHKYEPTLRYTDLAWPYLSDRALVVFDDIRWSDGMERAWSEISAQSRWSFVADVGAWGVCAVDRR